MPDERECAAMTTTSECVALYRLFTNSGLSPDEAAELVDGIARLDREQRRLISQKLADEQLAWAEKTNNMPSEAARVEEVSSVVGSKEADATFVLQLSHRDFLLASVSVR